MFQHSSPLGIFGNCRGLFGDLKGNAGYSGLPSDFTGANLQGSKISGFRYSILRNADNWASVHFDGHRNYLMTKKIPPLVDIVRCGVCAFRWTLKCQNFAFLKSLGDLENLYVYFLFLISMDTQYVHRNYLVNTYRGFLRISRMGKKLIGEIKGRYL